MLWRIVVDLVDGRDVSGALRGGLDEVGRWPDDLRRPAEDALHELRHRPSRVRVLMLAGLLEGLLEVKRRRDLHDEAAETVR